MKNITKKIVEGKDLKLSKGEILKKNPLELPIQTHYLDYSDKAKAYQKKYKVSRIRNSSRMSVLTYLVSNDKLPLNKSLNLHKVLPELKGGLGRGNRRYLKFLGINTEILKRRPGNPKVATEVKFTKI